MDEFWKFILEHAEEVDIRIAVSSKTQRLAVLVLYPDGYPGLPVAEFVQLARR